MRRVLGQGHDIGGKYLGRVSALKQAKWVSLAPIFTSMHTNHSRILPTYCLSQYVQNSPKRLHKFQWRGLLTVAIETSCDDTSVAVLEKNSKNSAKLHFNSKITSDNRSYGGIHPINAHESHQKNLAILLHNAMERLPICETAKNGQTNVIAVGGKLVRKPDFVTVTRGPGMRANLITGVDTAKGLAVAWQVPLVGVNHIQAHALTPRLVSSLNTSDVAIDKGEEPSPTFPFLSLLVSGGHTILVHSRSIWDHEILAETSDIALGDMLDKSARAILPISRISSSSDVVYGRLLEEFVFPLHSSEHKYTPLKASMIARDGIKDGFKWKITPPFLNPGPEGAQKHCKELSFSGIGGKARSIMQNFPDMSVNERRCLGKTVMTVAFEHLGSRVLSALKHADLKQIKTLVVSGGVASNKFLRTVLRHLLDSRGFQSIHLDIPPPELCTDNAAMIAWTGMEMFEAGFSSQLSAIALKQWTIDSSCKDGGILGVNGWQKFTI
ncbi:tRNA N6-adenosine threonylcarbamoyltransferase, mitochondrial [Golovinomyces cichoracearum]|uniref:N(6)-L-threonylcarbamoyladenine synthase n=1 Tax=Golovinomyces cichoracearum TaxID=62708 RepID=A0A420IT49_9PEZI|nr:tRNA N6-adenosine threonylcarbamoyltransferase, mitochondrial [Golovinomyces cichoracearum]